MRQKTWRRAAVLVLVAALAAPAAWAAPGGVGGWELGGVWGWFARVVGGWADKDGPCITSDGKPAPCAPAAWSEPEAARRLGATKDGPCIDPLGRPTPCAVVAGSAPASRRLPNDPSTPRPR